ncbi:hypothetical protein G6F62_013223 [Rhizopus arrhizus]|nr:hypothetical protein G6F62_013223 [Rhizopus arrhizus]
MPCGGVAGELRIGSFEAETRLLAHRAAGAVAADQPAAVDGAVCGRLHSDLILLHLHRLNRAAAIDVHAQPDCALGQYRFQRLQLDRHLRADRRWQPPVPAPAVHVVQRERNAGEVAPQRPRVRQPVRRAGRGCALVRLQHLGRGNRVQQAAPIQRLQGGGVQAAQAQRQAFQG